MHNAESTGGLFSFPALDQPPVFGDGLHTPYGPFQRGAAGIGHVNLTGKTSIPLFVAAAPGTVPAFGLELLRTALGADRAGLQSDGDVLTMKEGGHKLRWVTENGTVAVNYVGPLGAFAAYPYLEVFARVR